MFDNKNKVADGRNAIRQDVVYEIISRISDRCQGVEVMTHAAGENNAAKEEVLKKCSLNLTRNRVFNK